MSRFWLRWAGSKRRALSALSPIFDRYDYDTYIEPFVGAGTVFFNIARSTRAILCDRNKDLILFYRFLRDEPDRLWKRLQHFPPRFSSQIYGGIRERFNSLPAGLERAATFFFLNRTCFNGVYRVNQRSEFNVPVGSRRKFKYPRLELFQQLSKKLQSAEIIDGDFRRTLQFARLGTLFYIDPPYTGAGDKRSYDRYVWPPFQRADLQRLQRFVESVVSRSAYVIVSYSGSRLPWFVPSDFVYQRLKIYRSISCDGMRGRKTEICACSNPARPVRHHS